MLVLSSDGLGECGRSCCTTNYSEVIYHCCCWDAPVCCWVWNNKIYCSNCPTLIWSHFNAFCMIDRVDEETRAANHKGFALMVLMHWQGELESGFIRLLVPQSKSSGRTRFSMVLPQFIYMWVLSGCQHQCLSDTRIVFIYSIWQTNVFSPLGKLLTFLFTFHESDILPDLVFCYHNPHLLPLADIQGIDAIPSL